MLAYLHVSPYGVHSGYIHAENHDPAGFNEAEIIKKALKRAVEIADHVSALAGKQFIVDVHYDNLPEVVHVAEILDTLHPGDVISHVMQVHGETMFEPDGTVNQLPKEARKRGIWVDDCHGRVHWSFENLKKAYADGFYPDIISSDVVRISMFIKPGSSLVHAMCVNSAAGMDDLSIFKAITYTPAKALGILDKAGTLDIGKPADVCIIDVRNTDEVYLDWWGGSRPGNKVFVPMMTRRSPVPPRDRGKARTFPKHRASTGGAGPVFHSALAVLVQKIQQYGGLGISIQDFSVSDVAEQLGPADPPPAGDALLAYGGLGGVGPVRSAR